MEILKWLQESVRRERTELWPIWIVHHDIGLYHKALCQAVSGTKLNYWTGTSTLFPWFGSEWLLAVSKNVCIKGTKILGYWRH